MKKCLDCRSSAVKRGYCETHYAAARRTGLFTTKKCSVEDCPRNVDSNGFCQKHYQRFRVTGDPERTLIAPHGSQKGKCGVPDCDKAQYCKGYCEKHYRRLHDHGRLHNVMPSKNEGNGWIDSNGYHRKNIDGKHVGVHRLVMEKVLGRPLKPTEHVHHIDGDKLNNDPSNLIVLGSRDHAIVTLHSCPNCTCPRCNPTVLKS